MLTVCFALWKEFRATKEFEVYLVLEWQCYLENIKYNIKHRLNEAPNQALLV